MPTVVSVWSTYVCMYLSSSYSRDVSVQLRPRPRGPSSSGRRDSFPVSRNDESDWRRASRRPNHSRPGSIAFVVHGAHLLLPLDVGAMQPPRHRMPNPRCDLIPGSPPLPMPTASLFGLGVFTTSRLAAMMFSTAGRINIQWLLQSVPAACRSRPPPARPFFNSKIHIA